LSSFSQQGFTYLRHGSKSLLDKRYETIVKDTFINWHDGTEPGNYYKVKYNFGEPIPTDIDIVQYFLSGHKTDTIRGWVLTSKNVLSAVGDEGFDIKDITLTCTNKINSLLPFYVERISMVFGSDEKNRLSIKVFSSPEELKRRDEILKKEFKSLFKK